VGIGQDNGIMTCHDVRLRGKKRVALSIKCWLRVYWINRENEIGTTAYLPIGIITYKLKFNSQICNIKLVIWTDLSFSGQGLGIFGGPGEENLADFRGDFLPDPIKGRFIGRFANLCLGKGQAGVREKPVDDFLVAPPLSWPHHVEQQSQGDFQGKAPLPGKIAGIQYGFQRVSVREELLNEFGQ